MINLSTLTTGWNAMRWFRLVLAIAFAYQAITMRDALSGFFSAFLLFQVVTNVGCCGVSNSCSPSIKKTTSEEKEIVYEEIK